MRKQRGLSLITMLLLAIVGGFVMILAFALIPVFNEYFAVKQTLTALVSTQAGAPPDDIRAAFVKRATIQDIHSIGPDDLNISEDNSGTSISVSYQAKVHLIANASLVFDFSAQASHAAPTQ